MEDIDNDFYEKEDYQYTVLSKIDEIYETVIRAYQRGDLLVDEPGILFNLSIYQFRSWVLDNNDDLKKIF